MEDELEKKKKGTFSFLRTIGLESNKDKTTPDKNVFYSGNVATIVKNKKKALDEIRLNNCILVIQYNAVSHLIKIKSIKAP